MILTRFLPALALCIPLALPAQACGPDTDCTLGDHSYRIAMPDGHDGTSTIGALIFAHGYKGSSRGTMRNAALRELANRLGVALVAPDAIMDDWSLANAPAAGTSTDVDELAYFDALRTDLIDQHRIDPDQSLVAGFSAGGMMVWTLACNRPRDYAGFVAIAGTFWNPVPPDCTMPPANIVHIHGTSDKIVPLAGRPIAETRQGNVDTALAMYREQGAFTVTDGLSIDDGMSCEAWQDPEGTLLAKCLHPGGHSFKASYIEGSWTLMMP